MFVKYYLSIILCVDVYCTVNNRYYSYPGLRIFFEKNLDDTTGPAWKYLGQEVCICYMLTFLHASHFTSRRQAESYRHTRIQYSAVPVYISVLSACPLHEFDSPSPPPPCMITPLRIPSSTLHPSPLSLHATLSHH